MPITYPQVNGFRYDWSSVEVNVKGRTYLGCSSVDYKAAMNRGKVRGTHTQSLGFTRGQYEPDGSFEMPNAEADEFIASLGDGFMEEFFDIVVSYAEKNAPTRSDVVYGCLIKSMARGGSNGTDPLKTKFELDVTYIIPDGNGPVKNMRT